MATWHLFTTAIKISEQLHSPDGEKRGGADAANLGGAADEEYPLFARRKAPHNQRMEQMPFGDSSSATFDISKRRKGIGYEAKKTEHSDSKKGCGAYWGRKTDAKKQSNRKRREQNKFLTRKEMA